MSESWYFKVADPADAVEAAAYGEILDRCPHGEVMVGLDVGLNGTGSGAYADAVRGICVNERDLIRGEPLTYTELTRRSDPTTTSGARGGSTWSPAGASRSAGAT